MPDPDPTPTPVPDPAPTPDPAPAPTFTPEQQAIVDRIVQERVARVKTTPPPDYEELKAAADKLAKIEEANKTEIEKAHERATKAEADAAAATQRAQDALLRAAIIAEASGKLADPSDAVALIDRATLEFGQNGEPTNVADVVQALLTAKPHLAANVVNGTADQGARNGAAANQITREQLDRMGPEEVTKALAEGRLSHLLGG